LRNLTDKDIKYPYTVTRKILEEDILNLRIPYKHDKVHLEPMIGKINGLYATCNDTGGITQIEAVWLPTDSNLKLELTGHQGKVMQESMHVAKTLSWSLLPESIRMKLKDNWKNIGTHGIHVHCPEGATPKDGPSAGAAITTAMYSLLSGKKIRNDIAITGEIDLSGKIMEIGGLESKIFGAKMAGCKKVLCPKDNLASLQRIIDEHPDIIDENFQVKIVSNIQDVFNVMLQ
jgi:ATP-dependent Lon protease